MRDESMATVGSPMYVSSYMAKLFATTAAASYNDQVIVGSPPETPWDEAAVAHTWAQPRVDLDEVFGRSAAAKQRRRSLKSWVWIKAQSSVNSTPGSYSDQHANVSRTSLRRMRRERRQGDIPSSSEDSNTCNEMAGAPGPRLRSRK